jgi:hypothetical protein
MENIIIPNETFDFSKLSLGHPVSIQGGAYFTKIEFNQKPLYIQTVKSFTKQGILKSGKKYYCDLMFSNSAGDLISWFEILEEKCQHLIFDKKDEWFQTSLDRNDIENAFNSTIKTYKSGKFYLVRTNIKSTQANTPNINIYDENLLPLTVDDITPSTEVISILEIQGIKFTSRNFQIEMNLKQFMVLDKEPIFDNCLIKRSFNNDKPSANDKPSVNDKPEVNALENEVNDKSEVNTLENEVNDNPEVNTLENQSISEEVNILLEQKDLDKSPLNNDDQVYPYKDDKEEETKEDNKIILDIQDLENVKEDINPDLIEEISIDNSLENIGNTDTITLRRPNQIYYDLYKKAREKAKQAKKEAIIAYLEAKNIKNTYMLDNTNDTDYSVLDEEIDDVSESELEDFEQ